MQQVTSNQSSKGLSPMHVAIIMDGNGRWALSRGRPRIEGHRKGAEVIREIIKASLNNGVRYLTLFGFSIENWRRPTNEVNALFGLLRLYLHKERQRLHERGVRIRFIGELSLLPKDIFFLIKEIEKQTKQNRKLNLMVALSYGGRQEITSTIQKIVTKFVLEKSPLENLSEKTISENLYTAGIPDPDLLIRTGGEKRISNFLLWQLAYTELVFTDKYWPDFLKEDFEGAISEFYRRERRYGIVS